MLKDTLRNRGITWPYRAGRVVVLCAVAAVLVAPSAGWAIKQDGPVTVSPGRSERIESVGSRCPTFSWGGVAGARAFELVVYQAPSADEPSDEEPRAPEKVLSERIIGSARSWTPELGRCLEPGLQYAWAVRARLEDGTSDWSQPALFAVPPGPGEEEFEAALALVKEYLISKSSTKLQVEEGDLDRQEPSPRQASAPSTPAASAAPELSVDGGVVAASFTGDGSTLTSVDAQTLQGLGQLDFARSAHLHTAANVTSGTFLEARIPAEIARDSEVAASFLPNTGGVVGGNLGVGATIIGDANIGGSPQSDLHVRGSDINISDSYLFGEDILIEDGDAQLGLYSSDAGNTGSAIILGETPVNSLIGFDKWAIFRETRNGGNDLRFTFGPNANYTQNDLVLELGDDGSVRIPGKLSILADGTIVGKGIPRAYGVVTAGGSLLPGSLSVDKVVRSLGHYRITLTSDLLQCNLDYLPFTPITVSVAGPTGDASPEYQCGCDGESCSFFYVRINDGLASLEEGFSFVVW